MIEKSKKWFITTIMILTILFGLTFYYAVSLKEKYDNLQNNYYTEAFSNLVNYVNNVENYLAKAMISKSPEHGAETLTEIWRDSNLAIVYLSRIPIKNDGLSQTAKFLNQVSDYSHSLARKTIEGNDLTQADLDNLNKLHDYSIDLNNTLEQLLSDMNSGKISWKELTKDVDTSFAQQVNNLSATSFSNINENF